MKKTMMIAGLLALAGISTYAVAADQLPAGHYHGEKLAKKAKITIDEAQTIALKTRPGELGDRELEKEKGGSGLRYTFDIKADGVSYEVGVDAATGAILENAAEGKKPD